MDDEYRVASTPIGSIRVGKRQRGLDPKKVVELALSIEQFGLINPITVADDGVTLIAGHHRLAACQWLNWEEVPTISLDADDPERQILEIDENLTINCLTVLEQAEHLEQRRQILTAQGQLRKSGPLPKKEFVLDSKDKYPMKTEDVGKVAGLTPGVTTVRLRVARLPQDVRDAVRHTDVAKNQEELTRLAKLEPDAQQKAAEEIKAGRATTVRQAVRQTTPSYDLNASPGDIRLKHADIIDRILKGAEMACRFPPETLVNSLGLDERTVAMERAQDLEQWCRRFQEVAQKSSVRVVGRT